jgi:hypothetical protein
MLAVILICASALSPDACTRQTALDVQTQPVPTPFACMAAGQAIPARDGLAPGTFAKTLCERRKQS